MEGWSHFWTIEQASLCRHRWVLSNYMAIQPNSLELQKRIFRELKKKKRKNRGQKNIKEMSGLLVVVLQYSASSTTVHTTTEYVLLLLQYMFCGHTMSRSLGTFFEWHSVKARTCARCKNFKISARTLTLVSLNIRTFYIWW